MNCRDGFLSDILHDDLQYVILGHLSKENNYEELAYETVKLEISIGDNPYRGDEDSNDGSEERFCVGSDYTIGCR